MNPEANIGRNNQEMSGDNSLAFYDAKIREAEENLQKAQDNRRDQTTHNPSNYRERLKAVDDAQRELEELQIEKLRIQELLNRHGH